MLDGRSSGRPLTWWRQGASAGGFALADIERGSGRGDAVGEGAVVVGSVPVAAPLSWTLSQRLVRPRHGGSSGRPGSGPVCQRVGSREEIPEVRCPREIFCSRSARAARSHSASVGKMVGATVWRTAIDSNGRLRTRRRWFTGLWGWLKFCRSRIGGAGNPCDAQVGCVFGVRDLSCGECEGVNPDAVNGAFAILTEGGAHEEPGGRDGKQSGFEVGFGVG